jgi:hypothetical protein
MNQESLKLTGRVVRANTADQSFLIEVKQSHSRLWVYADNKAFQKLNNLLLSAQFKGTKGKELTGTFCIQGRVLFHFELPARLGRARAFSEVKYSPENPGDVTFETNKNYQTVSALCAILNRLAGQCHQK